jgi:hypothetical protein
VAALRSIVDPFPSIVIELVIAGSPFGPYQLLLPSESVYVHPWPSCTVFTPPALLALATAEISDEESPVVPEHAAVNVAPDATLALPIIAAAVSIAKRAASLREKTRKDTMRWIKAAETLPAGHARVDSSQGSPCRRLLAV